MTRYDTDKFERKVVVLIGYEPSDLRTFLMPGLSDVIRCAMNQENIAILFPATGEAWEGSSWPTSELNEFFALADWFLLGDHGEK